MKQAGIEHEAIGVFVVDPKPPGDTWRWSGTAWIEDTAKGAAETASREDSEASARMGNLAILKLLVQKGVLSLADLPANVQRALSRMP